MINITSRWARFAHPPAACDLDIFHYITAYIHNVHVIQVLTVNKAVWKGRSFKYVEVHRATESG